MNFMIVSQFIDEQRTKPKTQIKHLLHVMGKNTTVKKIIPDLIRHSLHIVLEGSVLGRLSSNQ